MISKTGKGERVKQQPMRVTLYPFPFTLNPGLLFS